MKIVVLPEFRLYVQHNGTAPQPAGFRLQRRNPLPITTFSFPSQEEADAAAGKLQAYVDKHQKGDAE